MQTAFLVSIKCPECGSPAHYPEGAFTFQCDYCGSVLRVVKDGTVLKYIIPCRLEAHDIRRIIRKALAGKAGSSKKSPAVREIRTIYKPFWYFKSMVYYRFAGKTGNDTLARTWYYSFQAHPQFTGTFHTLSVRTEVLAVNAYDSDALPDDGMVLPVTVDREEAGRLAEAAAKNSVDILVENAGFKKLSLIGEHFFLVYYPVIQALCSIDGRYCTLMIDGVGQSVLENEPDRTEFPSPDQNDTSPYRTRLLTHRCKNCGHDLCAGDFDVIFYCQVCYRLWLLDGDDYRSLHLKILDGEGGKHTVYIPFWRFETTLASPSAGVCMKTLGDLSGFMKMGRFLLRHEDPDRPIRFYVPALVARNARALIQLASRINIHQKQLPLLKEPRFPFNRALNASLPEREAEEMLEVAVFSIIGRRDPRALSFYRDLQITVDRRELLWYPFEEKGNYYADHFHRFNFPKKSLDISIGFKRKKPAPSLSHI